MQNEIAIWHMDAFGEQAIEKIDTIQKIVMHPGPTSLDDATRRLPGGGYTTFRTFGRFRVLRLADHFIRLEEAARLSGKPVQLDRDKIARSLHLALASVPWEDVRVRVILALEGPGTIFVLIEKLTTPVECAYQNGVKVVTRRLQRENPKAKLTGFIETAAAIRQDLPAGVNEAVMVDRDGRLLEGLSSNFFAIKDGVIWTAEQGVLSGITRGLVLEVIQDAGIPLKFEGVCIKELSDLEEAFITSASRAVLPVTEIDTTKVGNGAPGRITQAVMQGYRDRLENELDTV